MAKAFNPNDFQLILLSTAAQRDGGHLLPLPDNIAGEVNRAQSAIAALLKNGLVAETPTDNTAIAWREEADQHWTVHIADAGLAVIGDEAGMGALAVAATSIPAALQPKTKIGHVVDLLRRDTGATLVELADATGWLPHTTRAALTGLRKKGHAIEKESRNKVTYYRIAEAA